MGAFKEFLVRSLVPAALVLCAALPAQEVGASGFGRAGFDPASALSVLTYNVSGNGATDWSTNSVQVQAIGRQVRYLQPDVITFNEIPDRYVWQMTNFVAAFLPGYYLATNSIGDGSIRSVIASRYPIRFSASYLHGTSLAAFGYSGAGFTRDLFQAQVAVPGFPMPLEVFVTHLKATTSSNPQNDALRRAAEAGAISNFLAMTFRSGTNGLHPYLLSGDLNEDIFLPDTNRYVSGQPIQRLVSPPTGLQLTTPLNPITHADLTESIRTMLNVRFDYILPCGALFSNIVSSQVFRTDLLSSLPGGLLADDDKTASDHLPVLMVFANPYAQPFALTSITFQSPAVTLQWESIPGQSYRLERSPDLLSWSIIADQLRATGANFTFRTNLADLWSFFRVRRLP